MIGVSLLAAGVLAQARLFPVGAPYQSRAEFHRLYSKIQYGFSKAQIIEILGQPDSVKKEEQRSNEILQYGVDSATGVATLANIVAFPQPESSKFVSAIRYNNRYDPAPQKMDEQEVRSIICWLANEQIDHDSLWTIRIANRLIELGDKKARFVLFEFERSQQSHDGEYWKLLDVLFTTVEKANSQEFVKSQRLQYLHPDVPILVEPTFLTYTGPPPTVLRYRNVPMRRNRLAPPNDPLKLARGLENRDLLLSQLAKLVRGAVSIQDVHRRNFDSCYLQFLRSGAVWSDPLQCYTKADGTVLPDPPYMKDTGGIHP